MIPDFVLGALNMLAYLWAVLVYALAAVAGIRAVRGAFAGPPAAPFCLIADASRWVIGLPTSGHRWKSRDFIALGVFGTAAASIIAVLTSIEFLLGVSWQKLGHVLSLHQVADDLLIGSALIILHCGVAARFKTEKV